MDNQTTMAMTKAVSTRTKSFKEARNELEPGEYEVDTTVRLTGKIKVSKDSEGLPTSSLLNQEFLALVLHHAGVTRNSAVKILDKVASDYLSDWSGSDEDKAKAKAARKAAVAKFDPDGKIQGVFNDFKEGLPKITSKGKVKWEGSVEEIGLSDVTEIESIVPVAEENVVEIEVAKENVA